MNETILDINLINKHIKYWRNKKKIADTQTDILIAACYIDCLQSIRVNHNLPLLEIN